MESNRHKLLFTFTYLILSFGMYFILSSDLSHAGTNDGNSGPSVVQYVKMSKERLTTQDIPGALQNARAAVALDPAYPEAWKQLGRVLMIEGNYREAVSSLDRAQDMKPEDEQIRAWSIRAQVMMALKSGRINDAKALLEAILKSNPGNEEMRQLLAQVYTVEAAGANSADAEGILAKIVTLEPERGGAWRDLGWALFAKNRFDEAVKAWDHALQDKEIDRKPLIEKAVAALAEQKQTELAKQCWQRWSPGSPFLPLGMRYMEMNRLMAAKEIFTMAWSAGEDPVITGLYLAYTEARSGACQKAYNHLKPYSERAAADDNDSRVETYIAALRTCSFESGVLPLILKLEELTKKHSDLTGKIADIYEKAGRERQALKDYANAYKLHELVLIYDPNRPAVWPAVLELAKNTNLEERARTIIADTLKRTDSEAVREGIMGFLAEKKGDLVSAVNHYNKSLDVEPNQAELRFFLFEDLITLKRYPEAKAQSDWFAARVAAGSTTVKTYLANSLSALGKNTEALAVWQELYLTMPENPYYAVETARSLFLMCRADEAKAILKQLIEAAPSLKAFELLAEIESAFGNYREAFDATTGGLALENSQTLLRIRAETADIIGEPVEAQRASQAILEKNPGNVSMQLILGRALTDQRMYKESVKHYENLLARNDAFLPSLTQLRNYYSSEKVPDKALGYADRVVRQRPWDLTARQLLALSQVEADRFPPALEYLRAQSAENVERATPILVYAGVLACPYDGRNNLKQVTSHIERLSAEGYRFVTPQDLGAKESGRKVIVVFSETEPAVMEQLDLALKKLGGKALFVIDSEGYAEGAPGSPSQAMIDSMKSSGRWTIASGGPANKPFGPATKTGADKSAVFLYPNGNYGQLSLDTNSAAVDAQLNVVAANYRYAIVSDERGFTAQSPGFDPYRLPGRFVPAEWDADDLSIHLKQDNPLVRARLELGKVLYLHSQHERANVMFREAQRLGADPEEVNFFWGSNAHIEDDLPTALEKLRKAVSIDPDSERNAESLQRSEHKKHPLINAGARGWEDSDNRSYLAYKVFAESYVTDRLQLSAFTERNRWSRDEYGSEIGHRAGAGMRWYFKEEYWLDATLWYMDVLRINEYFGGSASLHIPNAPWGGYVNLEANHEEVDTVEAVREKITAYNYAARTYSRIRDEWDLYADLVYTHYTDDNDSAALDGIFMKRLHEWPFLGLGYRFRFGYSSRDPDEYWSPQSLQQHEAYITVRGEYCRLHYTASGEAGIAHDANAGWRFVWGTRIDLAYYFTPHFSIYGRYSRRETPQYNRDQWNLGVAWRY